MTDYKIKLDPAKMKFFEPTPPVTKGGFDWILNIADNLTSWLPSPLRQIAAVLVILGIIALALAIIVFYIFSAGGNSTDYYVG